MLLKRCNRLTRSVGNIFPIRNEKIWKKSSIALAYIILSLVNFQSTNLRCTAILMKGQHATGIDAFKRVTYYMRRSPHITSQVNKFPWNKPLFLSKLQQGGNVLPKGQDQNADCRWHASDMPRHKQLKHFKAKEAALCCLRCSVNLHQRL